MAEKIERELGPISSKACQICFEDKATREFFPGLGNSCTHSQYCLDCTRQQLKVNINDSKVLNIKCFDPECDEIFDDARIKDVLSGDPDYNGLYKKYLKFKQMKLLDSDPSVKWCPRPGCDKFVRGTSSKLVCECT